MRQVRRCTRTSSAWLQFYGLVVVALLVGGGARAYGQRDYTVADAGNRPKPSARFLAEDRMQLLKMKRIISEVRQFKPFDDPIVEPPEYHDDQGFASGSSAPFGPMASVFALPGLIKFSSASDFEDGFWPWSKGVKKLVALINVDAPGGSGLSAPYQSLHLVPGKNCVYLAHDRRKGEGVYWRGYVVPPINVNTCSPPAADNPYLEVEFFRHGLNGGQADYPPVARFVETLDGQPLIAIRCGNATCFIGPQRPQGADPFAGSANFHHHPPFHEVTSPFLSGKRAGRVQLWHDDQMLATGSGTNLMPTLRATITPARNAPVTNDETLQGGKRKWLPVAWLWIGGNPSGTKYGEAPTATSKPYWGMHGELNLLELTYDPSVLDPVDRWQGQITQLLPDGTTDISKTPRRVSVKYDNHGFAGIPSTARFRWKDTDEGVWIPCDQGCCRVDAFY